MYGRFYIVVTDRCMFSCLDSFYSLYSMASFLAMFLFCWLSFQSSISFVVLFTGFLVEFVAFHIVVDQGHSLFYIERLMMVTQPQRVE
jgi:hypothetical protein